MMSVTLYPELVDYVFGYCDKFMNDKERKASWHHFAMEKSAYGSKVAFYAHFKERNFVSTDKEVLDLLADGFQSFKEKVATRVYNEHKDELNLNICPKCFKIARTPQAKQCRFCSYNWH